MSHELTIHEERWPPVTGTPGVTQGHYGEGGNLELVACDLDDGLWVGWFNLDQPEPEPDSSTPGTMPRHWSGALHFAAGHGYRIAHITQADAGPSHLEVVGLTTGDELRRHVWTPESGFVDHGSLLAGVIATSGVIVAGDRHEVCVAGGDGLRILTGRVTPSYPSMAFEARPVPGPPTGGVRCVDAVRHDDHLDILAVDRQGAAWTSCPARNAAAWEHLADGVTEGAVARMDHATAVALAASDEGVLLRRTDGADAWTWGALHEGDGDAIALAASVVDGDPEWQIIVRQGPDLRHHRVTRAGTASTSETTRTSATVSATVLVEDPVETCHRRAVPS